MEVFGSGNRTNYSGADYGEKKDYLGYGARFAFGADHYQIGAEYHANITHPAFQDDLGYLTSFEESYYGGFLRAKLSKYPAMRFGLVFRAGAGIYQTKAVRDNGIIEIGKDYDPIFGANLGAGFSIPVLARTMIELGYTFNYLERRSLTILGSPTIPWHKASYHSLSVGMSLNFVFGKRAAQYREVKEKWKYRKK